MQYFHCYRGEQHFVANLFSHRVFKKHAAACNWKAIHIAMQQKVLKKEPLQLQYQTTKLLKAVRRLAP